MEALTSSAEDIEWIHVEEDSAIGRVRRTAVALADRLGFSEERSAQIAIAATELATNLRRHAVAGTMLLRVRRSGDNAAVELIAVDAGPGIANLALAMRDGESDAGTLGIGLGAVTRLASYFDTHTIVGRGTVMIATFWETGTPFTQPRVAAVTRPFAGETLCGDASAYRTDGGTTTVMLADGLGHGDLAARAAKEAVNAFRLPDEDLSPAVLLARINTALRATRGAAVAVARLDPVKATVTFAGIGNVGAWIVDDTQRRALVSTSGIVGAYVRTIREVDVPLPEHALLVLHSDGLTSKWDLNAYPGLRARDLNLVAATLLRDAGVHRDDVSVAVARAA